MSSSPACFTGFADAIANPFGLKAAAAGKAPALSVDNLGLGSVIIFYTLPFSLALSNRFTDSSSYNAPVDTHRGEVSQQDGVRLRPCVSVTGHRLASCQSLFSPSIKLTHPATAAKSRQAITTLTADRTMKYVISDK
jgi:hypothetical protein